MNITINWVQSGTTCYEITWIPFSGIGDTVEVRVARDGRTCWTYLVYDEQGESRPSDTQFVTESCSSVIETAARKLLWNSLCLLDEGDEAELARWDGHLDAIPALAAKVGIDLSELENLSANLKIAA